ncbi:MAG: hypothetical protein V4631_02705 [Pseudomonadota bacterium]
MLENLIVMLIVVASAWYAGRRYLPAAWIGRKAKAKAGGCGGGCDTCGACETPVEEPRTHRVIKLYRADAGLS